MRINIISTVGSEYDGPALVPDNSTVGGAIEATTGESYDSSRMQALVNGAKASADTQLSEGDRLTITPSKVTGF